MFSKKNVQSWLKTLMDDQIAKILANGSNLTKIQIETLLIDCLSENAAEKQLKMDEKARLRLNSEKISRGSFNRTLIQARKNVAEAIYTILLLGYVGIFESTRLDPYIEMGNRLQAYVTAYRNTLPDRSRAEEELRVINMLRGELEKSIELLSSGRAQSPA